MSGRPNTKWRETMIKRYGSAEALQRHIKEIAARGGRNGRNGGFASEKVGADGLTGFERARIVGQKGGMHSKIGEAKKITVKFED